MSDYLTDREVAKKFAVGFEFVQDRCRAREWPHLRVGKSYRFKPSHVEAIEALCEVAPADVSSTPEHSWGLAPGRRST